MGIGLLKKFGENPMENRQQNRDQFWVKRNFILSQDVFAQPREIARPWKLT